MIERIRKTKSSLKQLIVPGMFFEDMGITYLGPIQGHNIPTMVRAFKEARKIEGPVLLHVITKKWKRIRAGRRKAGKIPWNRTVPGRDGRTGKARKRKDTYTDVFFVK